MHDHLHEHDHREAAGTQPAASARAAASAVAPDRVASAAATPARAAYEGYIRSKRFFIAGLAVLTFALVVVSLSVGSSGMGIGSVMAGCSAWARRSR